MEKPHIARAELSQPATLRQYEFFNAGPIKVASQNHVLTCLASSSNVPPRLASLGRILAPKCQRLSGPSEVSLPFLRANSLVNRRAASRLLPPLGKESHHYETSHNNAGAGGDDVQLDGLLLLVAVVRQRLRKPLRSDRLRARRRLRCSGLCSSRDDELPNV